MPSNIKVINKFFETFNSYTALPIPSHNVYITILRIVLYCYVPSFINIAKLYIRIGNMCDHFKGSIL